MADEEKKEEKDGSEESDSPNPEKSDEKNGSEKSGESGSDSSDSSSSSNSSADSDGKAGKDGDTANDEQDQQDGGGEEEGETITYIEWIAAALGFLLVFGSLAYMTYKAVVAVDKPPDMVVRVKSIEDLQTGYLVKFEVKNNGEYAAAAANIKGELKQGDKTEETSTTTVDYVPSYSTRSGGIFFSKNPRDYQLELRATGYTEP